MKTNLLLSFCSILITLFLVNAVLELSEFFKNGQNKSTLLTALEIQAKKTGLLLDRRSKIQVVDDLRAQGMEVYPSAYTHHFLESLSELQKKDDPTTLVPLGMISYVQYVLCNELGQWSRFPYDRYGFHNQDNVYTKEGEEVRRVLLIGDSMVEGQCVQEGEDIASRLRQKGFLAISLGMGGSGPVRDLAVFKEYGVKLQPKVILWFFTETNDIRDLSAELEDSFLKKYLNPNFTQNLIDRQDIVDEKWKSFIERKIREKKLELVQFPESLFAKIYKTVQPYFSFYQIRERLHMTQSWQRDHKILSQFQLILAEVKRLSDQIHAKILFIYLPSRNSLSHGKSSLQPYIRKITETVQIPMIDLLSLLAKQPDSMSVFPYPDTLHHYNAKGYQKIAEEIGLYLVKEKMVSRKE